MEDYTYHLGDPVPEVLGAHMLEVCPSIAARPARRARSTRCRSAAVRTRSGSCSTPRPGPAVVVGLADLGDRFRLIANEVDLVEPDAPLPRLPVARAVWRPRPDLPTAAEAWLTAGGPHHTALTTSVATEAVADFAEIAGIELVTIDACHVRRRVPARAALEPGLLLPRPRAVSATRLAATPPRRPVLPTRAPSAATGPWAAATSRSTGGFWAERAADQPRADAAARVPAAGGRRAPSRTSGSPRATSARRLPRARDHVRRAVPVPRLGRLQVARGRRLGARAIVGRRRSPRWPTRRSTPSRPRSARTATSTRSSRSSRRVASTATSSSGTSCTASGTSSRRPSRGTARWATTACSPSRARAADRVDRALGPATAHDGIDGHPEIEMALVELYRATGESRYLELARLAHRPARARPAGLRAVRRRYWQDHLPVREARGVTGHAVRQLYLDAGAVDVAVETGDARSCSTRCIARWRDMVATRSYLTGGLGSRHAQEAFGDPYELPPDRAYTETCAAIASVMLAWRLLLATGDPDAADVIERTMSNGVLSGCRVDGTSFFYVNPLQRRTHRVAAEPGTRRAQALVRLRLLPAERGADASRAGRSTSRRPTTTGSSCGSTRTAEVRGPRAGRRGAARDRDRLPVGRRRRRHRRGGPGHAVVARPAGPPAGPDAGSVDWAGGGRAERWPATAGVGEPAPGGPATSSRSTSTCPPE